jgi:hypothetical protein
MELYFTAGSFQSLQLSPLSPPFNRSPDAISATDNGQSSSKDMMYQWVNTFPLAKGGSETTICDGTLQAVNNETSTTAIDRTTYCSKALASKKYTQP